LGKLQALHSYFRCSYNIDLGLSVDRNGEGGERIRRRRGQTKRPGPVKRPGPSRVYSVVTRQSLGTDSALVK
jgi:hypothetical protein